MFWLVSEDKQTCPSSEGQHFFRMARQKTLLLTPAATSHQLDAQAPRACTSARAAASAASAASASASAASASASAAARCASKSCTGSRQAVWGCFGGQGSCERSLSIHHPAGSKQASSPSTSARMCRPSRSGPSFPRLASGRSPHLARPLAPGRASGGSARTFQPLAARAHPIMHLQPNVMGFTSGDSERTSRPPAVPRHAHA